MGVSWTFFLGGGRQTAKYVHCLIPKQFFRVPLEIIWLTRKTFIPNIKEGIALSIFLLEGSSPSSSLPRQLTSMSKSYVLWRKTDNTWFYPFPGAFIKSCIRTTGAAILKSSFQYQWILRIELKKNNGRLISSKWFTNSKNIILQHSIVVGQHAES